MKSTSVDVAACFLLALCSNPLLGIPWDQIVFRDDFSGGSNGLPDPDRWVVNVPEHWWWTQGRSFYPSPVYHPAGPFPRVADGRCVLAHHTYNPYDLAPEHWTLLGGQIHTARPFEPMRSYRFEALIRCDGLPSGSVGSVFTYGFDGEDSDEIDVEIVPRKNIDDPRGDGAWVLLNTWNESRQKPTWAFIPGLDLARWNRFRIYWYPARRVEWTWLSDPNDDSSEVLLRSETDPSYVPDQRMGFYSNIWAADSGWPGAFDRNLRPVDDPAENQICAFELNEVEVRVPEPVTLVALLAGVIGLLRRNRRDARVAESVPE